MLIRFSVSFVIAVVVVFAVVCFFFFSFFVFLFFLFFVFLQTYNHCHLRRFRRKCLQGVKIKILFLIQFSFTTKEALNSKIFRTDYLNNFKITGNNGVLLG